MSIFILCVTLTCEFAVDHDVQVFLWVSADISGDGVQADGGILQEETHPRAVEPRQTPEEKKTTLTVVVLLQSQWHKGLMHIM